MAHPTGYDPKKNPWPALLFNPWRETLATLHRWLQIVGKIRLAQTPWTNHSWHVALYLTARGLTTSPIPHGTRVFQLDLDFIKHELSIQTADGMRWSHLLRPQAVADFYRDILGALHELGLKVSISPTPSEIADALPLDEDRRHAAYDPDAAARFFQALLQADRVFKAFRARFVGKCSPVHFFWGSFDLAVTRFSGRPAPPHPGGFPNLPDWITREAYSHEVSSAGFWPGGAERPFPLFFSYAYPEPESFPTARVLPKGAYYDEGLREFVLPYEEVRQAADPDGALLSFLQSTYEAAAEGGGWDRPALERKGRRKRR